MSIVIKQTFPLGRFHATRWGQNPFEDRLGEWPPSPWRLLRALAARWFQYQRETGIQDASLRDELLQALATELPAFRLPAQTWRGVGSRQYHPTALEVQYKYKKGTKKELDYSFRQVSRTLTLDSYRTIPPSEPVYWIWRFTSLSPEASGLLKNLLRRIHYFGRAEAWTTMQLIEADNIEPNCELRSTPSSVSIPVLVHRPDHPLCIDLLLASTDDKSLSSCRIPPGTSWYHSELPSCPKVDASPASTRHAQRIHVVRYALDSTVLPLVTDTLPVAEAARRMLMGLYGRHVWRRLHGATAYPDDATQRPKSAVLSGKDASGTPLQGHGHAYYLPTDEDGDGRLDHLTIYAASGFGLDEQRAFDKLHELRGGREAEARHPVRVLLLGMGTVEEFARGPLQASRVWESSTPYIATRYAKTRGGNRIDLRSPEARAAFLIEDLRAQLWAVRPDIGEEVTIEPLWNRNQVFSLAERWRPIQFKRFRWKRGDDGGRRLAGAFRLTFLTPVRGPLVLGWSSHFGLGQFMPVGRVGTGQAGSGEQGAKGARTELSLLER